MLKIVGLLIMMVALHGCKEHHGKQAVPHIVQGSGHECFADLPHQSPVMAAVAAYERRGRRLLIFEEYGEGNYAVAPVADDYNLDTALSWQPGWARVVSMSRDRLHPPECVDCDHPPDACGSKKQVWLCSYNSEMCRLASARGLGHCGVKYVQP